MDEAPALADLRDSIRDGFAGQRMSVVPRPTVQRALQQPVTSRLVATDAGFFPHAVRHGRSRPAGAEEDIVLLCTDGAGWYRSAGTRWSIAPGDVVVIPAGLEHEYAASQDDPWTLWWMHLTGPDSRHLVAAALQAAGGAVTHLRDPSPVASLISQVIDALEGGTTTSSLTRSAGAAWHALTHVIATGRRPPGASSSPVERAVEHLRATAPQRTSSSSLAAMVGLSASQLTTLFQRQVGMSPLRFQTELRMGLARRLLDTTQLPVSAVARQAGYDDALYFSRQFARVHGVPPSAYRARGR
ncbi:helix-turn-helix domain-containing protein [Kineococcus sp. SYSU DK005]|uniref:helix-turn-helix domain-containing protein n=1 Tax=Kineococcus sp. SYSU DK005 TaxID=3383126 RepID=UPI003D7D6741